MFGSNHFPFFVPAFHSKRKILTFGILCLFSGSAGVDAGAVNPKALRAMREQRVQQAAYMAYQQQVRQGLRPPLPYQPGNPAQSQPKAQPKSQPISREDFNKLMARFKTSSTAWVQISDPQTKIGAVSECLKKYHERGVEIKKPASHYAAMIDDMSRKSPEMLGNPLAEIVQVVAIIEYDFDNGQNKNILARKVLGEKAYRSNKKRLGLQ